MPLLNHDTCDAPAIRVILKDKHQDENIVITVEAATLTSTPYVRILNEESKLEEIISLELATLLDSQSFRRVAEEIVEQIEQGRFSLNHPNKIAKNRLAKPRYNRKYDIEEMLVKRADANKDLDDSFIPYIQWQEEDASESRGSGWVLSLTGYEDLRLGFAPFDDPEAILKLIDSMSSATSLKAMACLIQAQESSQLVGLEKAKILLNTIEETNKGDVKDILTNSPTILDQDYPKEYYVRINPILLNDIAIAYSIDPPDSPQYREPKVGTREGAALRIKFFEDRRLKKEKSRKAIEDASLDEVAKHALWKKEREEKIGKWMDVFILDAQRLGWNVISQSRGAVVEHILISKITKQAWEEYIEPIYELTERVRDRTKDWVGF